MKKARRFPVHDPTDPEVQRLAIPLWTIFPDKKILLSKEEDERRMALMVKASEIRWDFE